MVQSLSSAGLVSSSADVTPMSGGVSSSVWLITEDQNRFVAKSPLAKLRTPQDWFSDVSRGRVEYLTLQYLSSITPDHVPEVIFFDESLPLMVMKAAPSAWVDWRAALLSPSLESNWLSQTESAAAIGAKLGTVLAKWHSESTTPTDLPPELLSGDRLRQLRTDPFHRATSSQIEDRALRLTLLGLADELDEVRVCLAYGDYSPKNVLIGRDGLWVIDAETAHFGHPVIDTAFLTTHLLLKSIHRIEIAGAMFAAWQAFIDAYESNSSSTSTTEFALKGLGQHTGALMAARVLGISRASYLTEESRAVALKKAKDLLRGAEISDIWQ